MSAQHNVRLLRREQVRYLVMRAAFHVQLGRQLGKAISRRRRDQWDSPAVLDGRTIAKVGLQPEPIEKKGEWIRLGGQYVETDDVDFFEQGKQYTVRVVIERKE